MRVHILLMLASALLAVAAIHAAAVAMAARPAITDEQIDRLISEAPARAVAPTAAAGKVRSGLSAHVREMTRLEHLAPLWYFNGTAGMWIFAQPRETFEILATALPALDAETRAAALSYLDRELEKFDPLSTPFYPVTGLRRFPFNAGRESRKTPAVAAISPPMPIFAAYGLWAYAWYGGRTDKVLSRWEAMRTAFAEYQKKPFVYRWKYDSDQEAQLNRAASAMLGVARLARLARDEATAAAAGVELARLAAMRLPLEDDARMVHIVGNGTALARYWDLSPEVGRLVRQAADSKRQAMWINLNAHLIPDWYLAWTERPTGLMNPPGDSEQDKREYIGSEYFLSNPIFAESQFAAKAMVLGEDAGTLAKYLDIPWCRGDLYYIAKAAAVLRADAGWRWEKTQ
jgi:hypothetical protein